MSKKDLDKIKLPENLDNIIDDAINKAEEDKKKNRKNKGYKKGFGTIAAGLAIATTVGLGTTTLAYGLPAIKSAFSQIQNGLDAKGDYAKYATEINQTVNDNGIGITLSEVLCDGQNLYVTYVIKSEESFKYIKHKYDPVSDYDITEEQANEMEKRYIDYRGKSKVSFGDKAMESIDCSSLDGKFIDDHTFVGLLQFDLTDSNKKIPDEFEFTMNFDSIMVSPWHDKEKAQIFNGSWNFKVPVKVDKSLFKETKVNDFNKNGVGVQKVLISPFEFRIFTTGYDREKNDYWIRIYDEEGNMLQGGSRSYIQDSNTKKKYSMVAIVPRGEMKGDKIKVEIFKPFVEKNGKEHLEDPRETVLYSKEINLEK